MTYADNEENSPNQLIPLTINLLTLNLNLNHNHNLNLNNA